MFGLERKFKYSFIYRCTVIVWMTIKFITQIYIFHFRHSVWDERTRLKWESLLIKQAKEYRDKAIMLGGVLIKVGQFLSTRNDFMPEVFIRELSGLVDRVPPSPFPYAKSLLEEEWNSELTDKVSEIGDSPVASASIGEVYRATLKDGSDVAIKIQRYRIQDIFHMDFRALKIVFWIISVFTSFGKIADLHALYRELVYVMDKELNFKKELEYGIYFRDRYKDNERIHVPFYFKRLCTKKVMVMEWVEGAKITDLHYMNKHHINVKQTAKTLFDFYLDQFLNDGLFHADPHAGNILVQKSGLISIIDFGMVGDVRRQDTHYFKRVIQGLIMDDYDKIMETLDEMNFLLPGANKKKVEKMIKQTVDMYENGSFQQMDAETMDQLKEDIRIFIKDQPIQLSADYAYLGRAMSIILGVLIHLYPEIDIGKWAKPTVKQWLGGKGITDSIYSEMAKDTLKPVLSYPRAMLNWLERGEKDRQWQKEKHQSRTMHHFYILLEGIMFTMLLIGSGFMMTVKIMAIDINVIVGVSLLAVISFLLLIVLMKHYRMIKFLR
ncbi:ABC1 kinase family protein [Virgibacillus byunsanensis]|uniref:ABC1 kinase family protein n=1 Tax=Virgibacillus byunsanensis TaxID=570945 RepID=UPI0036F27FDB